ncbi:MAG TPA: ABC transporter permease [Candidatus Merdiplasma excrementigallinarum]|uniref:Transport permease protein n=1 Tax=Candidatus Merdiplasma excrementigallinarum TaxID=2840864 RepID=A0A9D1T861_9FIRM|nr:ABC transporter permease [Candidatus Merdiplasma excrementigallinarum]
MNTVKELLSSRRMIWKLAKNDFKTKYAGSYFGILWAFVQPIVTILIYIIIFQYGFKAAPSREGYPYALTLTSGIIPWFFFSEALINATNCFMEYSYLVKKVVFKISILPVVKVVSSLFVHLFFVALVFLIFVLFGKIPPVQFIQIVYYIFCAFCFALALSFLTSAIVPFFRDFGQIVNIVLQVWMWACPIMWDLNQMLGGYPLLMKLIKLNPFVYVVEGYRDCYINGVWFWERGLYTLYFWAVTLALGWAGFRVFKKLRVHFSDVL